MMSSLKLFKIICYIKQIDSKLPCVCSVIDHRGRQNVVRTDAQQLGIYLLNGQMHHHWHFTFNQIRKKRFHVAVGLYSNGSQRHHKSGKNISKIHVLASASYATLCSYHILTSAMINYWTDPLQHGICMLNLCSFLLSTFYCKFYLNNMKLLRFQTHKFFFQ